LNLACRTRLIRSKSSLSRTNFLSFQINVRINDLQVDLKIKDVKFNSTEKMS
jgi:hypothetical protein